MSKHIAQKYIDRLPEQEQYYKLDNLRSRGFPLFMIRRIQLEVERNLAESIVPPQTDWANMKVPAVQEAWDLFLNAIRSDARLPASYARSVLETVTEDIVDLLVQPRKNLPEIIFGSSNELSYEEVKHRVQAIVVYRHFASLIPRYMERKELDKLTKDQCSLIVGRADEKLTRHYTPLNWAQMLEPLFTLLDEQIDSSLLHLFFEDKKMPRIARSFDLMNRSLNRAQLIEVLSSPELLNFEGYEEDQSDLFVGGEEHHSGPPVQDSADNLPGKPEADDEEVEERLPPEATKLVEDETDSEEEDRDPILSGFHKSRTVRPWSQGEVEGSEAKDSLNAIFQTEEDAPESELLVTEDEEEKEDEDREEPEQKIGSGRDEEASDGPPSMWERFLEPEPEAEITQRENEEAKDEMVEEGFIEKPILDISEEEGLDSADLKQMHSLLTDGRNRFVKIIFRGSDTAYEDAIRELAAMKDWRSASRYIEKEIFKRNLVDMYSETAVDFTDRLQTYFIKATKSNRS